MDDFPIFCHIRYDAVVTNNGKLNLTCTDVSDRDFVEVVRCKDCIHADDRDCPIDWPKNEEDYCSFGERRADNG